MFPKPILLATGDSNEVYSFWRHHKECGVLNPLHVVSDGEDVVKYLEASRLNYPLPGLLLMDLKLPQMGGLEVLEYLKRSTQWGFATVALIGKEDLQLMTQAHQLGAHSCLMKPVAKAEFCALMARVDEVKMKGCAPTAEVSPIAAERIVSRL